MKPATKYTKSGRINIAYQVFGSGPVDLVYIPGWVSNIDWMWACPELVHFLEELGKMARVILFDKRGTGLSDRVVELSTLEERMDDIRAVMDAIGSSRAILFGHSEGGSVSALFAATYPNRTIALITFGVFAKRRYAPDYPWAPTDEERQQVYDMIETSWGSGQMDLASLAPSKADDPVFMDWLANYFRSGASPSAAMVLTRMNTEVDIIDILGSIRVPTLMMQRTHDIDVKIEEGRFIAQRIRTARFVEFSGDDHLFWAGNVEEVLEEMRAFIEHIQPQRQHQEQLFTIAAGQIKLPKESATAQMALVNNLVAQYRGRVIRSGPESFVATFEGPSKAVHCSMDLVGAVAGRGGVASIGIHIREGSLNEAHFISSETAVFAEAILKQAPAHQILITQTVKHLLSGAGLNFIQHKAAHDPVSGQSRLLFAVTDHEGLPEDTVPKERQWHPKNASFLENILQCIDQHLSNEAFGVEMLCRETGISERQLQRKLKAVTNKSPSQLIASVRLHRAKELLQQGDFTISEIGFKTGFSSASYFSKCFKGTFGYSPSDLRDTEIS